MLEKDYITTKNILGSPMYPIRSLIWVPISKLCFIAVLLLTFLSIEYRFTNAAESLINDPHLKVDVVFRGIKFPTSMAFLGPNDILVLEKNNGTVQRIINGKMLPHPLLHVNVVNDSERGMLGIAIAKRENVTRNVTADVFLYYTEAVGSSTTTNYTPDTTINTISKTRITPNNTTSTSTSTPITAPITTTTTKTTTTTTTTKTVTTNTQTIRNRLYQYELVNNKLINPKILLDLPGLPGPAHNGGKVLLGPDDNIYVAIGDVTGHTTQAENVHNGGPPDGTAGILRITKDGQPAPNNPLGGGYPQNLYYAYGIRNIFGMDFDPITGKLWDTENGQNYGDEINLVEPGFNSGWINIQGFHHPVDGNPGELIRDPHQLKPPYSLEDFGGKGKYRAPEFIWNLTVTPFDHAVAPTALKFLNSSRLGKEYQNDLFVGDFKNGNIYHFKLNENRTGLSLNGTLADKVADSESELRTQGAIFVQGFGGITDLQVGPDGYLYFLSLSTGGGNCRSTSTTNCVPYSSSEVGSIFRIAPLS
jgi:aldose sugar dehydrogenase